MGKIIGIDLGTTNSCVSVMEGGKPVVIVNAEGARTTPSVIGFAKGERLVGRIAKRQLITNHKNTVYSIKRFIGRKLNEVQEETSIVGYQVKAASNGEVLVYIEAEKKDFTPQELSAMILKKMKETAESYLGMEISEAVVTVPAYFNDAQRQATKDAGKIAGLEVKRIINEPTAAALAYGLQNKKTRSEKVAVYDLGGGTFDISILEVADGVVEVLSTNGDTHLGGDDFDKVVMDWLIDKFKKDENIDLSKDSQALQKLKEAAENAKVELSGIQTTNINLPFITANASGPKHLNYDLTLAEFNRLTDHLIARSIEPCRKALSDAKLSANDINEVLLVGGSTRIPAVVEAVEKFFGKKANSTMNPDEVVAFGAAVQGGILGGDESVQDILLLDVTPLTLGLETLGGVRTPIIDRNTTIPTKKSQIFSTAADNQSAVTINILQGERPMAADNRVLGRFDLVGIPPAMRGVPQIEVTFDIDANGILHVSAKDKGTGKEHSMRIERPGSLSEDEINRMVKEAEAHAAEDNEKKEKIQKKNELDGFILSTEKSLKEYGDKLSDTEKNEIEIAISEAKEKHEKGNTAQEFEDAIKALSEKAMKLGEIVYKNMQAQQGAEGAGMSPEDFINMTGGQKPPTQEAPTENSGPVEAEYEVVENG
ncbi:MAG: molecular chaperone DnaK [Candidatus Cloacimonetes bacterium]|nr:molecular chaperone DnaK [Candidatus Cloacimonadota bacterium]